MLSSQEVKQNDSKMWCADRGQQTCKLTHHSNPGLYPNQPVATVSSTLSQAENAVVAFLTTTDRLLR